MDERDPQTYQIIGAAMEVHRVLGNGFLEQVYQHALAIEFKQRQIPFVQECLIDVQYKGKTLPCKYKADFICYESVLVELKALSKVSSNEHAQVLNYLKATGHERALLLNFGQTSLQHKRIVKSSNRLEPPKTQSA